MALEGQQREVSQPLEQSTGTVKMTEPDDADDGDTGTDDGGGDDDGGRPAPAERQSRAKGQDGQRQPAKRPGTRAERRQDWAANNEVKTELARMQGAMQAQQQAFQREIAQIRAESATRAAPTQQQQASPQQTRMATLARARESELSAFRAATAAGKPYDLARYNELEGELVDARAEAAIEKFFQARGIDPNKRPEPRQNIDPNAIAQQVANTQRRNTVASEFPWVADPSPQAQQYRGALVDTIMYLRSVEGRPDGVDTDREAAAIVAAKYNLGGGRPARAQASRYASPGTNNMGGARGPSSVDIPAEMLEGTGLTPEQLRRAIFKRQGNGG